MIGLVLFGLLTVHHFLYGRHNMSIKKRGNKWIVTDKSGKRILGTHTSREAAVKQLRAIEANKHRKKGRK